MQDFVTVLHLIAASTNMESFTECELPPLLEEAMQVIAVLQWLLPADRAEVAHAATQTLERLYESRRQALEAGCPCCRRHLEESRLAAILQSRQARARNVTHSPRE